jgi:hypothetical protein
LQAKALTIIELDAEMSLRNYLEIKALNVIQEAYYVRSLNELVDRNEGDRV